MINKLYEKSFAKREAKRRQKFGDKTFLEIYIPKFKRNKKSISINIIFGSISCALWIFICFANYFGNSVLSDTFYLVMGILFSIMLVFYFFYSIIWLACGKKFYKNKIIQLEKELQKLITEDTSK